MAANRVSGVFSVTNNLRTETSSSRTGPVPSYGPLLRVGRFF